MYTKTTVQEIKFEVITYTLNIINVVIIGRYLLLTQFHL